MGNWLKGVTFDMQTAYRYTCSIGSAYIHEV